MDRAWFIALTDLPAGVPGLGAIAVVVGSFGLLLYGALLLWLWSPGKKVADGRRRLLLLGVLAAALSLGVNAVLNAAFPRPRPFLVIPTHVLTASPPHDSSFPSDHAALAASVAVTLLVGGEPGWGAAALVGAVLIGAARVMMGLHYPSDIVGGLVVGSACGAIAIRCRAAVRPVLDFLLSAARRLHLA